MIKLLKLSGRLRLTILALALSIPCLNIQAQGDIRDGLVAYWEFEGDFRDSVGIFDGEAMGADPIEFVTGKAGFGKSGKFNGEDQYALITGGEPDDLAFEAGTMSLSVWFKVDEFDKSWQALVAKGEGGNWRIHRRGGEGGMAYTGGPSGDTPTGKDIPFGEWHHLVAITDAEATEFGTALYINGELDTQLDAPQLLQANGERMRIADNPGATGRVWEGEIDDIAIWNRVLTPQEIGDLYNNGAGRPLVSFFGTRIEVLGVGAEFLLGSDLTDKENDGLDELGAASDPSWNWASISSSHEPDFEGGENSFNIFDNKVGGGNDKWCCDDPTADNPVWVAVEFPNPVSISSFTVTSGNDTPGRDPTDWAIQGSNDGANWADIYHMTPDTDPVVPWTERNQVVKFTLAEGSNAFRNIRYIAWDTPANLHQLNEIEYFGNVGGASLGFISSVRGGITTFSFQVVDDGSSVVETSSVSLVLDGATIPLGDLTKTDGAIAVNIDAPERFRPNSIHTYAISAVDGNGNEITSEGSFTTKQYGELTGASTVTPDTSKPGFIWRVHQNPDNNANDNVRPVLQLAGELGENLADAFATGPAIDLGTPLDFVAGRTTPITFEVDTVINFNQDFGGTAGEFTPDDEIPGIPGIDGGTDGIAGEFTTYLELPAGPTTFIVNSDDGFLTTVGILNDVFLGQVAGQFSGGRGAADTAFVVYIEEAGVYPVRTVWEEGGGGANIEFKTEKADGTRALVNDTANGGVKAYRAITSGAPTAITAVSPAIGAEGASPDAEIQVTIEEGGDSVDSASVTLTLDGTAVSANVSKSGSTVTISHKPAASFAPFSSHTVNVEFTAGSTRSESWSFDVPPFTRDTVSGFPGAIVGAAQATADGEGITGQAGDLAMNIDGSARSAVEVSDSSFLSAVNSAMSDDQMTTTVWVKQTGIANSSTFWFNSPGSGGGSRGWQAHTPWGDSNVYFDTAGCCGGDTRISAGIDTASGYTDESWWNDWHHFTFLKSGDLKEIYIDGEFFHTGNNTGVLPTDINYITLGSDAGRGNNLPGMIDDFTIYDGALSPADIASLAGGAAPSTVSGLVAHWDFNDSNVEAPAGAGEFTGITRNADGSITIEWTGGGTLQSAPAVDGPWTDVAGATSPLTLQATEGALFGRLRN